MLERLYAPQDISHWIVNVAPLWAGSSASSVIAGGKVDGRMARDAKPPPIVQRRRE
jgi:hypothetical protein